MGRLEVINNMLIRLTLDHKIHFPSVVSQQTTVR